MSATKPHQVPNLKSEVKRVAKRVVATTGEWAMKPTKFVASRVEKPQPTLFEYLCGAKTPQLFL